MIRDAWPAGRTDSFKAMGNTKWGDIELKALPLAPVPSLLPLSR
jgi:hypothetical protein